ncbi:TetR/AcrR family transcriptional regulator [Virgibacillus siamensis]|uniref:TetR/AcrR family transcriptional regulator n=1 Tax=Virgibacillus siamensis TaxID=480071 RepID=UPI0009877530|nr:TetR/AcrR family transcriptional regulator [Virgibacillus siamensis]
MARERKFTKDDLFQAARDILLDFGYEGFTFSLLAEKLHISRGAIYKYYKNKDELVIDYMLFHMHHFMEDLKGMETYSSFKGQFDFLIEVLYKHSKIHQILRASHHIPAQTNQYTDKSKNRLDEMHHKLYAQLQTFLNKGRKENILKPQISDDLILVFIFQLVEVPNHSGISRGEWIDQVTEILRHGMFTKL